MNMFSYNSDFYPTPEEVIAQMMMGEDIVGKTILEPSAGSGNIVDWLKHPQRQVRYPDGRFPHSHLRTD